MNTHSSSPCRCHPTGRVEPRRDTPPPHRGSPVLSHPATVPSQMPLRGPESHSETISALSQCRTLETLSKGLRLAYSASGPPARCTARRGTTGHTMRRARTSPSARVVTSPGVAILTLLTRQKSHRTRPNFDTEEIGRYRVRGGGRGCDPTHPHERLAVLGLAPTFPQEINATVWSTNPAPALSGPCCWTSFL